MPHHPPIQIVNEDDEPIGEASLPEVHERGLRHRIVFVLVEDSDGKILIQQRSPNLSTYPNRWDISAAGHVDAGETYERAAERELEEELGLAGVTLRPAGQYYEETTFAGHHLNRFCRIYRTVIPAGTPLKTEPTEVADTRWLTRPEVEQLLATRPDEVAVGLVGAMRHYRP